MPLRETRRFKARGPVISFGDIMLPLVGIIAICLLFVAGRLFFASDSQPSNPLPISPPTKERAAQAEMTETGNASVVSPAVRQESAAGVGVSENAPVASNSEKEEKVPDALVPADKMPLLDLLAVPYNGQVAEAPAASPPPEADKTPEIQPTTPSPRTSQGVQVVTIPKSSKNTQPKKQPAPKQPSSSKTQAAAKPPAPQPKETPRQPVWKVQVGAYSTAAAAETVKQQLSKGGYAAEVIAGKSFHRVLVHASSTRDSALNTAKRLSSAGFPGAFIVPPR